MRRAKHRVPRSRSLFKSATTARSDKIMSTSSSKECMINHPPQSSKERELFLSCVNNWSDKDGREEGDEPQPEEAPACTPASPSKEYAPANDGATMIPDNSLNICTVPSTVTYREDHSINPLMTTASAANPNTMHSDLGSVAPGSSYPMLVKRPHLFGFMYPSLDNVSTAALSGSKHKIGIYGPIARKKLLEKYMEKRARRLTRKTVRYRVRKTLASARPRVKGRFVKTSQVLTAAYVESQKASQTTVEGGAVEPTSEVPSTVIDA